MEEFGLTELVIVLGLLGLVAYLIKETRANKKEAKELKDRVDGYIPPTGGGDNGEEEEEE